MQKMKNILETVFDYYNNHISSEKLYNENLNAGGKIRGKNGELVENMIKNILKELCLLNNVSSFKITGKKDDSIRVFSKNGHIDVSTDVHFYINEKPIFFIECKTYLDKCYFDRANSDFKQLKAQHSDANCVIVSLENGIALNAENYFMDQGNTDNLFYLVDGKRTSKKPIWGKGFYKPINEDKLFNLISYFDDIIKQYT
jgi:hypothetical protein